MSGEIQCACPRRDAHLCVEARYRDGQATDEPCECDCHREPEADEDDDDVLDGAA